MSEKNSEKNIQRPNTITSDDFGSLPVASGSSKNSDPRSATYTPPSRLLRPAEEALLLSENPRDTGR